MNMFERLAPFIKDYIYKEKWENLRDIQIAACDVIFNTGNNLLLASGTASGKTEAAFLPVLTKLYENPSKTIGILYISPLKTLINDQFIRLNEMIKASGINVTKWHGDINQTVKNKILKKPKGILQITPESLEAMLMKRKQEVTILFSDLRYIIIDEVHSFMNTDRGIQLLCILERISRHTGTNPVRIGLSATLGEYDIAEAWLNSGTGRGCITPKLLDSHKWLRLSLQHFYVKYNNRTKEEKLLTEEYYEYLYKATFGKRCILFSNSKAEVEANISKLKSLALKNHTPDVYMVHHGHISSSDREFIEDKMKSGDGSIVTGATLTCELGIDLGQLERIVQTGCPMSVSSFVQRMGRSGRRGQPAEILFVLREGINDNNAAFYEAMNWSFLRTLATINLYLEEKWIEPIKPKKQPFNVLYHQTMSFMASAGEVSPALLAQNILSLSPFKEISQEDYKKLLLYMIEQKQLEKTERNNLIIAENGEHSIDSHDFYCMFEVIGDFIVKYGSEKIGMVQLAFKKGECFALAGRSWKVKELDADNKVIYVDEIFRSASNYWDGFDGEPIHSKLMKKIKEIIVSDDDISYLSQTANERLNEIRSVARSARIDCEIIVEISEDILAVFPFVGKREMMTLNLIFNKKGLQNEIMSDKNVPFCIFIWNSSRNEILNILHEIKNKREDLFDIDVIYDITVKGKYDKHVPEELKKKQYITDVLDLQSLKQGLEL